MVSSYWPVLIFGFLGAALIIHLLRGPANKLNLTDSPGGRKTHSGNIPLVGGIAICLAFVSISFFIETPLRQHAGLFAGMLLMVVVGFFDDAWEIRCGTKFFFQALAAVLMTSWSGLSIKHLGGLFGESALLLGDWSIPFTILCVVALINAINMADGIDGLAGGFSIIALGWLGVAAILDKVWPGAILILLLCSCIAGFLLFNLRTHWRPRASVFLGDAGSMALGFAVAWFAVEISSAENATLRPIGIAWILALPVIDTSSLMVRRILKGQSPFAADREHIHHIFIRAGFSDGQTTALLLLCSGTLGAVGFFGSLVGISDSILFLGFFLIFCAHFYFIMRAWRVMRVMKRMQRKKLAKKMSIMNSGPQESHDHTIG